LRREGLLLRLLDGDRLFDGDRFLDGDRLLDGDRFLERERDAFRRDADLLLARLRGREGDSESALFLGGGGGGAEGGGGGGAEGLPSLGGGLQERLRDLRTGG
jgi:hypothetical protein